MSKKTKRTFLPKVETKARLLQAENLRLALEAIDNARAEKPDNEAIIDALDRAHVYVRMAEDWVETSYIPGDIRKEKERKGSEKGIERRRNGAAMDTETEDVREALNAIYNPDQSGEWHRKELARKGINRSKRQVERYLQKIRNFGN